RSQAFGLGWAKGWSCGPKTVATNNWLIDFCHLKREKTQKDLCAFWSFVAISRGYFGCGFAALGPSW
ncbi:MAG: hypothetical protein MI861_16680, partial [Pirellulales bacterium]|nr:hypothetical protein [Pirellulales bacterium]